MNEITMLGTGAAMVTKCYNTCFTISSKDEYFLVDTGGGNMILSNLEKADIPINKIHNVFISHSHNDHITGIVWIIRAVAQQIINGNYHGKLYIYCHKDVIDIIRTISNLLLQKKFVDHIDKDIIFIEIYDKCILDILDMHLQCFDIRSTKLLQFGFTAKLSDGKKLTFLGDEPFNESVFDYANKSNYLMHEAFCLYSQREKFNPYEKHHSTVKDACENASKLQVENVILFHTEDKNLSKRKELYSEEGQEYFKGKIIVPNDLEVIEL
ncbi:MBL fold metallo-hydrolase [Clostridium pasteurianum]|uniref:Metal-dependent hydrolase, beta-lactamase superfamily III n=1 Tax=Clostridium pasteurianum BC1 TaxID=86416 RepID=R4K3W9_CLOPA|nr:MBL fold metallo-hydrolase [Clostridium pasteurianum]AGK95229.1 metal-dependent hydrolase, beta-lactamase superfamily III [Clostridium pasteurianum BC1]